MKAYIFVSLQNDDVIARFEIQKGIPENRADFHIPGGPAPLAISPDKTRLYAGTRKSNELLCLRIGEDAKLSIVSKTALSSDPCFVGTDHGGRHVFSAYYGAGEIAVHRRDGETDALTETQRLKTEPNAHSVWLDSGDRFVYVPHTGPNKIYLYEFENHSGTLKARTPPWVMPEKYLEPRHLCFHPFLNCLYVVNESSSSVSRYDYDRASGSIKLAETVSALPPGKNPENTGAEIRITPNGRFLYASNRGHDSIACFAVDSGGSIKMFAAAPAPAKPRAFEISRDGRFLYAAGQTSGELAACEIDQSTGRLKELSRIFIGNYPMWILAAEL